MTEPQVFGVSLGLIVGLRHAFDADHLVALSTLVAERRPWLEAARFALLWGLGHSLTFLAIGLPVLLAGLRPSDGFQLTTELLVAAMLMTLGVLAFRTTPPAPEHQRDLPRSGLRPVLIGLVHGLAGSSAAALVVLGRGADPAAGVGYLIAFAVGMVLAMVGVMTVLAWSLRALGRHRLATRGLIWVAALANITLGALLFHDALNHQDTP